MVPGKKPKYFFRQNFLGSLSPVCGTFSSKFGLDDERSWGLELVLSLAQRYAPISRLYDICVLKFKMKNFFVDQDFKISAIHFSFTPSIHPSSRHADFNFRVVVGEKGILSRGSHVYETKKCDCS